MKTFNIKEQMEKAAPYFVAFFGGIGMSIAVLVILNIPMAALELDTPVIEFLVSAAGAVITMYKLSFRKGYSANSRTYKYRPKEALKSIAGVFALQIILTLFIGPAVYIAGPTMWMSSFVAGKLQTRTILVEWALMLLADVFLYAPAMLLGEYCGAKEHLKDFVHDS